RHTPLASLSLLGLCTAFAPAARGVAPRLGGPRALAGSVAALLAPRHVRASAPAAGAAMSIATDRPRALRLEAFAKRQWDAAYKGLQISMPMDELEAKVNELYWQDPDALKDGYAPFCKHLFVPCFLEGARSEAVAITAANEGALRSEYQARTEQELPVLVRWFPKGSVEAPLATHLDLILYSREQIIKESEAMGREAEEAQDDAPWGLISIKVQLVDFEIPMTPITMLRNALGKEHGGSGVPLDRDKYQQSVDYWSKHAVIA
ncbi:MAG: DUF3228 family protein, partial [Promethearchaeia archaeon]